MTEMISDACNDVIVFTFCHVLLTQL